MARKQSWTGERLETTITSEVMLEHLHRYAFAIEISKNKKVLDIACGEGYGSNLMSKSAAEVTGIDIDETTINNASKKYFDKKIRFIKGSILDIPADNGYFDLITCFETLEHVSNHEKVMSELKRVLNPDGIVLISTPEKLNYSDKSNYKNPFHKKELYGGEFKALIKNYFKYTAFYCQFSSFSSIIMNENEKGPFTCFTGNYEHIHVEDKLPHIYCIAIGSDKEFTLPHSGIFRKKQTIQQIKDEQTQLIKKTMTYKVGNVILAPFKLIKSFFNL